MLYRQHIYIKTIFCVYFCRNILNIPVLYWIVIRLYVIISTTILHVVHVHLWLFTYSSHVRVYKVDMPLPPWHSLPFSWHSWFVLDILGVVGIRWTFLERSFLKQDFENLCEYTEEVYFSINIHSDAFFFIFLLVCLNSVFIFKMKTQINETSNHFVLYYILPLTIN